VASLNSLIGGQPYLVRQSLYALSKNRWKLGDLEKVAIEERGPFGDHLRQFVWSLRGDRALTASLQQVLRRGTCDHETHFLKLLAAGLVRGTDRSNTRIRYDLYARYLERHL